MTATATAPKVIVSDRARVIAKKEADKIDTTPGHHVQVLIDEYEQKIADLEATPRTPGEAGRAEDAQARSEAAGS